MDGFAHLSPDERAAMDALRGRLRARAEDVVALVETVVDDMQGPRDEPLTPEDGWKAVRLMRQADSMVCQLYATPESVVKPYLTKPGRPSFADDDEDEAEENEHEDAEAFQRKKVALFCKFVSAGCRSTGFWPNGEPVEDGQPIDPDDEAHMARLVSTAVFSSPTPSPDNTPDSRLLFMSGVTHLTNAAVQHAACRSGQWPDGSPFDPDAPDPGYYTVSRNWEHPRHPLCEDETRAPGGVLWTVRRKPPPD